MVRMRWMPRDSRTPRLEAETRSISAWQPGGRRILRTSFQLAGSEWAVVRRGREKRSEVECQCVACVFRGLPSLVYAQD